MDQETKYIKSPEWNGMEFVHSVANAWWLEFPTHMRELAVAEFEAGNSAEQILKNQDRGIVLLAFVSDPKTTVPSDPRITVHTSHSYGNYCYNGTLCTYEDKESGHFLAFDDPDYEETAL